MIRRPEDVVLARALVSAALLAAIAFVLLVTVVSRVHGETICVERAGREGHWAYRQIEGRSCWYRGEIGRDKALLRWERVVPPVVTTEAEIISSDSHDLGLFEREWRDVLNDLATPIWQNNVPASQWKIP